MHDDEVGSHIPNPVAALTYCRVSIGSKDGVAKARAFWTHIEEWYQSSSTFSVAYTEREKSDHLGRKDSR